MQKANINMHPAKLHGGKRFMEVYSKNLGRNPGGAISETNDVRGGRMQSLWGGAAGRKRTKMEGSLLDKGMEKGRKKKNRRATLHWQPCITCRPKTGKRTVNE